MIANKSPLRLIEIQLLQSQFKFIPPVESVQKISIPEIFDSYSIDIDFVIQSTNDDTVLFFIKALINNDEKSAGYKIFTEMLNIFDVKSAKSSLAQDKLNELVLMSGLAISINNIRNTIINLTFNAPFKQFILPTISIPDLIKEKEKRVATLKRKPDEFKKVKKKIKPE